VPKANQAANLEQTANPTAPAVIAMHVAPMSRLAMVAVGSVTIRTQGGIVGDRYENARHRHLTVQSKEELDAAATEYGQPIDPALTRRNITLSHGAIPLTPGHQFTLGDLSLEVVRQAAPCKLLEDTLGRGAKLALHRRAGAVCRVLEGGELHVGDAADLMIANA